MKVLFLLLLSCLAITQHIHAQLPDGAVAPDFTLTDINGVSFDLYDDAVSQGKFVVIDFFATWCEPCWDGFNMGTMESMQQWYAEGGICDSDVIVIGIESDTQTSLADMHGTGSNTQGDYVSLATYPLFNPSNLDVPNLYNVNEFPTYYVICPNGLIYHQPFFAPGALNLAAESCALANDVNVSYAVDSDCGSNTYTAQIIFSNVNINTLNSLEVVYSFDGGPEELYSWSGSLAMGMESTFQLPTHVFSNGNHTLNYRLQNPNGQTDENNINNCAAASFMIDDLVTFSGLDESFSDGALPEDTWAFIGFMDDLNWEYSNVHGGCILVPCYEPFETINYNIYGWSPHVSLSGTDQAFLQFDYAYAQFPGIEDGLTFEINSACLDLMVFEKYGADLATAPPTTESFVPQDDEWSTFCYDLSAFIGTEIYLWFEADYEFGNNIYIDNVRITQNDCTVSLDEFGMTSTMAVYPNPARERVYVQLSKTTTLPESVRIINQLGQVCGEVTGQEILASLMEINTADLNAGLYWIVATYADHVESKSMEVVK